MLDSIKRKVVSAAVAVGSLLPQAGRVSYMGSQAVRAPVAAVATETATVATAAGTSISPGAAAVGVGAAGAAAGGTAVSSRGCGKAAIQAAETRSASRIGAGAIRSEADDVARMLARRPPMEPPFRFPGVIVTDTKDAARVALATEDFRLFDAAGREIARNTVDSAVLEREAAHVVNDVLSSIPAVDRGSEKAVAEAFQRARTAVRTSGSKPGLSYEFDIGTGKVKLKYPTARGEINGEFNAFDVARKTAIYAGGAYGYYQIYGHRNANSEAKSGQPVVPAPNQSH